MPHFFFHLHDGKSRLEDPSGICLPDAEAAWYQAYRSARDLLAAESREPRQWSQHTVEVEESGGLHVWTVPFREIVGLVA